MFLVMIIIVCVLDVCKPYINSYVKTEVCKVNIPIAKDLVQANDSILLFFGEIASFYIRF